MSEWEINIKPNGVSIKTQKTRELFDANGDVVVVDSGPKHRTAVAMGDFETAELFTAHVSNLLDGKYGTMIAHVVSESSINATRAEDAESETLVKESKIVELENVNGNLTTVIQSAEDELTLRAAKIAELEAIIANNSASKGVSNANRNQ